MRAVLPEESVGLFENFEKHTVAYSIQNDTCAHPPPTSPAAILCVPDFDLAVEGGRGQGHVCQENTAGYAIAAALQ